MWSPTIHSNGASHPSILHSAVVVRIVDRRVGIGLAGELGQYLFGHVLGKDDVDQWPGEAAIGPGEATSEQRDQCTSTSLANGVGRTGLGEPLANLLLLVGDRRRERLTRQWIEVAP